MRSDFRDASERHFRDAELLLKEKRLANADHLLGLSAECSLKAVMQRLGMSTTSSSGDPRDRAHRVHIDQLWPAFQSFVRGRSGGRYIQPLSQDNLFADWNASQRYGPRAAFSPARVASHHEAAGQCRTTLSTLLLDGAL